MPVSMIQPLNRLVDIDGEASKVVLWSSLRGERNTGWQVDAYLSMQLSLDQSLHKRLAWGWAGLLARNFASHGICIVPEFIFAVCVQSCHTGHGKNANWDHDC